MTPERGDVLLALARGAIAEAFGEAPRRVETAEWLDAPGSTFVCLQRQGALRGCVGSLDGRRPLREDVASNARGAAFRDARFPPLTRGEFEDLDLEVSLLSPLEALRFRDQDELLRQLRPGLDGLVLALGARRATFLPQVWEELPDPAAFFARLKGKAGLPGDFWSEELRAARYTVTRWREQPVAVGRV